MRYFLVTLLLLSYPGLLIAVYWLPSSGPRQVLSLSVAKDGSFTTSSADVHFHQKAIDFWAPDLTHKKTINSSGYLVGWAHALSPDGDTVAITTGGRSRIIEVVSVADDTLEVTIDAPVSARTLYFCGSKESTLLISDGDSTIVCSPDGKQNQRFQAMSGRPFRSSRDRASWRRMSVRDFSIRLVFVRATVARPIHSRGGEYRAVGSDRRRSL